MNWEEGSPRKRDVRGTTNNYNILSKAQTNKNNMEQTIQLAQKVELQN